MYDRNVLNVLDTNEVLDLINSLEENLLKRSLMASINQVVTHLVVGMYIDQQYMVVMLVKYEDGALQMVISRGKELYDYCCNHYKIGDISRELKDYLLTTIKRIIEQNHLFE